MFVDETRLKIVSGHGGDGLVAFRHEKYMEKGGPSGGDGGDGGSIIFKASTNENTLLPLRYRKKIEAENGENGKIKNMTGASGKDEIIIVPVGTQIFNEATNELVCDLKENGETRVILKGGKGGKGNAQFASSRNKAPRFSEPGEASKEMDIRLELKVMADAGLVGLPSVGKSSIISCVSKARPKIAAYHFTTLEPNLGMVLVNDKRSFVLADLPGLIEGASSGLGLGFQFLKHIERTKVIVHVLDGTKDTMIDDYVAIRKELEQYDLNLLSKEELIVINKMDDPSYETNVELFLKAYKNIYKKDASIVKISALEQQNLDEFKYKVMDLIEVENSKEEVIIENGIKEYTFTEEVTDKGFEVSKDFKELVYVVSGPKVEEMLRTFNENRQDSVLRFAKTLKKMGVDDELKKIGCKDGDMVRIGKIYFEFND